MTAFRILGALPLLFALTGGTPISAASRPQETSGGVAVNDGNNRWVPMRGGRAAPLRRTISAHLNNVSLRRALDAIARSAGLKVTYGEDVLRSSVRVTLRVDGMPLAEALTTVLDGTGLDAFVSVRGTALLVRAVPDAERPLVGSLLGYVRDAKSGGGVVGAEVLLTGTEWRATTDSGGRYVLEDVEHGTYTLVARRLGYRKESRTVTIAADAEDTVDVSLEPSAVALDELVTTATGQQRRRDLGNAITTINADSVMRTAPIKNLTDLLEGRVPGLNVQHTSGAPGDPARLRLRGLGSALRSNDPVVIVDGVRVYAAQSGERSGNLTNAFAGSRWVSAPGGAMASNVVPAPSPLDQIDPNIIDKIEVFKGPSAATLYGADAANGVIVITTKKGRSGPTQWTGSATYGRSRTPGRWPEGYYRWGHDLDGHAMLCPLVALGCTPDSLVRFQALNEPDLTVLGQGRRIETSLTAAGGSSTLTYRVSGMYTEEIGLLRLPSYEADRFRRAFDREAPDWMRRPHQLTEWSVSSNITALLGPTADVTLGTTLSRSEQQRSSLENVAPSLSGVYIDRASGGYYQIGTDIGHLRGPDTAAILGEYYTRTAASSIRFATSLNATWRPQAWLNIGAQTGLDVVPRSDESLLPTGLVLADSGVVSRGTGRSLLSTFRFQGTVRKPLRWGLVFETSLGADLQTTNIADLINSASGIESGTSSINNAKQVRAIERSDRNSVFGWYIEPRLTSQRFALSTGLRLDGGSAYGARVTRSGGGVGGLLGLPKLNGSWVISEEPWFPLKSLFSSLRIRGAYGQAQVQPGAGDRFRLYSFSRLATDAAVLSKLGNTELRPERSTEIESGFDADFLDNQVSLEFTVYRKTQIDMLMDTPLPGSVGGGTVLRNIGTVRNEGLELVVGLTPIRSSFATWTTNFNVSYNKNRVLALGRGVLPNPALGLVEGYELGGRWDLPILGFADQDGNGVIQSSEIRLGEDPVYLGRLMPNYNAMLASSLTLFDGAIGVSAGFTYETGGTQVDKTLSSTWILAPELFDPATAPADQAAVAGFGRTDYGVTQDISTLRFNSFSVNYQAPARVASWLGAQRLGIALQGSNLGIHTSYRGKDPDVSAWSPGEAVADIGQLPMPRRWQVRLDLHY